MSYYSLIRPSFWLMIVLIMIVILSFLWLPHIPTQMDISHKLSSPSIQYWLGTDYLGRDVFSRIVVGLRNSVYIAFFAILIGVVVGVPLGLISTVYKRFWKRFISHINDLFLAFPALIMAMLIASTYDPSAVSAIIAIGFFNIPVFARLTRGAADQIIQKEYILAAKALGKSRFQIACHHVFPNIRSILIVQATSQMSLAILAEAALSYLGLGIQAPYPSLGNMLHQAQPFLYLAPSLAIYPGIAIVLTAYTLNRFSSLLRDRLDPKS